MRWTLLVFVALMTVSATWAESGFDLARISPEDSAAAHDPLGRRDGSRSASSTYCSEYAYVVLACEPSRRPSVSCPSRRAP